MNSPRTARFCSLFVFAFYLSLLSIPLASSEALAQNVKITVGQAGINPGTSLFFIAKKENLYAKHGLDANIIVTSSTASAVQAMLGGSMHIITGGAGAAYVTAVLEGTPPFVLVSSWVNVFPYKLVARKEIVKAQELKGKTGQIGSTFGSALHAAVGFALAKVGLDVEKDVKLVQLPRTDWANVIAQLEKGDVQFSLVPPPYDRIAEKRGFHTLLSLPDMGIAWQQNGEWVPKSYLQGNRGTVLRFLRVIGDAMKIYFEQKDKTISYLNEFLGSSREDSEYAYETFLKWVDRNSRPKVEGIRTILDSIKKVTPKAASADPASFIDTSLVDQLVKEGYFK
ncbi:MAG: ABC transporter substrate-binding protein [Deltaproteobacteria bacterium]|nr:ABC transporter substrate-binding protein [Deltaproteobacteria bacterium]